MIKNSSKVDVLIIAYNQEDFIAETIESVLNQTYGNIRKIIIVDDCSNDNTPYIIDRYAANYSIIEPVLAEENKGIPYNVNRALNRAEAEYISIMGGDDLMFPEKIRKQVDYLNKNPDVSVCFHDMDVFNSVTGQSMGKFSELLSHKKLNGKAGIEYFLDPLTNRCESSSLYRRDAMPEGGMDTRLMIANDLVFDVEVLMKGKLGYIDEILGMYRKHSNNVSSSDYFNDYLFEELLIAYAIVTHKYPELHGHIHKLRSSFYFGKVMRCIMQGDKKRAKNISKMLISEGNYVKGTFTYLISSIMSSDILNMLYGSKYQNEITKVFHRVF